MLIRHRLNAGLIVAFVTMLLITGITKVIGIKVEQARSAFIASSAIAREISELQIATYDFLLNRSERAYDQWLLTHHSFFDLMDEIEQSKKLSAIDLYQVRTELKIGRNFFSSFMKITEKMSSNAIETEQIKLRVNRLLISVHATHSEAYRLSSIYSERLKQTQQFANQLVMFILLGGTVFILMVLLWTRNSISGPIQKLRDGAEKLGAGDLSVRTKVFSNDEIGELSRSLDDMAGKLEVTLASREELQAEVNHRKKAQIERGHAIQELQRSNHSLQQFAYVASHDLQEPLRVITGFIELFEQRYKGHIDEKADEYIGFISESASRMRQLIMDLLSYSRIVTQKRPDEIVRLGGLLDEIILDLGVLIKETDATVHYQDFPEIVGDKLQLKQLFQNIIANAIKFKSDQAPQVQINWDQSDQFYSFTVCDNGIGIKVEYREKIFEIFQRLHAREEYEGTGIGLALAKRIVEQHGGDISVSESPSGGTCFNFTIEKIKVNQEA